MTSKEKYEYLDGLSDISLTFKRYEHDIIGKQFFKDNKFSNKTYYEANPTELSTTYNMYKKYVQAGSKDTKTFWKSNNLCGPNKYVKDINLRLASDTHKNNPCAKCYKSPVLPKKNFNNYFIDSSDTKFKDFSDNNTGHQLEEYAKMCSDNPLLWVQAQLDENPYKKEPLKNWSSGNLVNKWYNDVYITNKDLNCMVFGKHCGKKNITRQLPGFTNKEYGEYECDHTGKSHPCKTINDVRKQISHKRGSTVSCDDSDKNKNKRTDFKCGPNKKMGPKNIIMEEIEDWNTKLLHKEILSKQDIDTSFKDLVKFIGPPNHKFEKCLNDMFTESKVIDRSMINELNTIQDITQLKQSHINYIRRKLIAFLSEKNHDKISTCLDHLYIDSTICDVGLTEQMMNILRIVFQVIGYKMLTNSDHDNPLVHKKLMEIIEHLGPTIPRVFDKIIDISAKHESKMGCTKISNKTHLLRKLYNKIFMKHNNDVSIDLGIDKLLSPDLSDTQFNRSVIMSGIALAFMKFI